MFKLAKLTKMVNLTGGFISQELWDDVCDKLWDVVDTNIDRTWDIMYEKMIDGLYE